jgi:predicted transglutaminase-like cysteine proteinase
MGWTNFAKDRPRDSDLAIVNDRVNDRIQGTIADVNKPWRIIAAEDAALDGCCHDYAVTKRADLLGRGWPASRLLLCVVKYGPTGYHMVLIAIDSHGTELVLDNERSDIVPWAQCGYLLVSRQSSGNPGLWQSWSLGISIAPAS